MRTNIISMLSKKLELHREEFEQSMEKLNNNFVFHFSWKAERMYKESYLCNEFEKWRAAFLNPDYETDKLIEGMIRQYNGSIESWRLQQSTNPISNICSYWEYECYKELLKIAQDIEKNWNRSKV